MNWILQEVIFCLVISPEEDLFILSLDRKRRFSCSYTMFQQIGMLYGPDQ